MYIPIENTKEIYCLNEISINTKLLDFLSQNIKELMAAEGEVWQRFYSEFKNFLPEEFIMNKRVKRPPDNPINALISFGNTLLYAKTISAIYRTHLDHIYMSLQKVDFH